ELSGDRAVALLASPEDGARRLAEAIRGARATVDAQLLFAEPRWGEAPDPLLDALVDAARGGARVRLLLDGHVDAGRNAATAGRLRALAAAEGLAIEVRVDAAPRTLHAKAVVVDGRLAYVGSMNWGRASALENREVGLLVEDARLAAWLAAEMGEDWEGPAPEARREVAAAPPALWLAAALSARSWRRRRARPWSGRSTRRSTACPRTGRRPRT
ncbi:MAG TPA: phospholipase D-like domain-containing protein, partial [Candidatus Thermoplasmatota archaeon]|nr:phospholipase D-like domain-containing protein [Candidatus Thermoplasmatota archaeon]